MDSLNVDSMDVIEPIEAFGSTDEFRLERKTVDIGFLRATKLILRRMLRVIEPVRMSFNFFAELSVDEGAAIESVDSNDALSKLSRFRLCCVVSNSPEPSSSILCKPSLLMLDASDALFFECRKRIIGDMLFVSRVKLSSSERVKTIPSCCWRIIFELFGVVESVMGISFSFD